MAKLEIQGLKDLRTLINERADKTTPSEMKRYFNTVGIRYLRLSQDTFRKKKDPFGRAWEKLKTREGQPLRDSGRLFNSLTYEAKSSRLRVFVDGNLKYAHSHNNGFKGSQRVAAHQRTITKAFGKRIAPKTINVKSFTRNQNIPQRMFIPNEGRLPKTWLDLATNILVEQFKEN